MTIGSHDRLAAVRRKFVAASKQRADTIEDILGLPDTPEKYRRLRHLAHKIAGSAGFYGEDGIAQVAARIDTGLQSEENNRDGAGLNADINELLSLLRAL